MGITHEDMGASAQESLALDHFMQVLPDPDFRAHLYVWCPATMGKSADTAARLGGGEAPGTWGRASSSYCEADGPCKQQWVQGGCFLKCDKPGENGSGGGRQAIKRIRAMVGGSSDGIGKITQEYLASKLQGEEFGT